MDWELSLRAECCFLRWKQGGLLPQEGNVSSAMQVEHRVSLSDQHRNRKGKD